MLRKEKYNLDKKLNRKKLDPIKILVLGGSQGAMFFDKMIKDVMIKIYKLGKISLTQQIYNINNNIIFLYRN